MQAGNETYLVRHDRLLEARANHGALARVLAATPRHLAVGRLLGAEGLGLLDALLEHLVERALGRRGHGVRGRDIGRRGLGVGVVGGHVVDRGRRLLAGVGADGGDAGSVGGGAQQRPEGRRPEHCGLCWPGLVVVGRSGEGEGDGDVRRVGREAAACVMDFTGLAVGCLRWSVREQ